MQSHEQCLNWFFYRFKHVLTGTPWKVVWKAHMSLGGVPLYGRVDRQCQIIYLSASIQRHPSRRTLLKTLIHELGHVVFPGPNSNGYVTHKAIYALESLVDAFSEDQLNELFNMLPEHPNMKKWR